MSRVHKSIRFNVELAAEDRLSDGCSPGSVAAMISVDAQVVLDLCADSERLGQLERLARCIEAADTDGLREGAVAMERVARNELPAR